MSPCYRAVIASALVCQIKLTDIAGNGDETYIIDHVMKRIVRRRSCPARREPRLLNLLFCGLQARSR